MLTFILGDGSGAVTVVSYCLQPMDCSPPGFSVHGDSPGKNTGMSSHSLPRVSSPPRDQFWVSCIAGRFFTDWATRRSHIFGKESVLEAAVWEFFLFALVTRVLHMSRISTLSVVLFNKAFTQFLISQRTGGILFSMPWTKLIKRFFYIKVSNKE